MPYFVQYNELPRDVGDGLLCPECFAKGKVSVVNQREVTPEELKKYNCSHTFVCCCAAFTCPSCGHSFAVSLAAPEMNW